MLKIVKRIIKAYQKIKEAEQSDAKRIAEAILNDPLTIEMISNLARDCGRAFEIIRPSDGVIFRFYKHGSEPVAQEENRDTW